jgi:archaellin
MKNKLTIFLICITYFATAQTNKLTKEAILKDGTIIKYVVGSTYKIHGSFGNIRYGENDDVFDTITIKLKIIDKKLQIILNDDKEKAFELSKDQTPDYYFFQAYEIVNYFDLLLPQDMVSKPSITTYNVDTQKPMKSNQYKYPNSSLTIMYNDEKQKLSTSVYKSDYMNEQNWHFVYSFNNDKDFPIIAKEYFIVDNDSYEGLYCKLISIETKN